MNKLALILLLVWPALADDWYLFTSFRGNGESGVYLAMSQDGRRWTPLNSNQPWIKPEPAGMLMRDPFLAHGEDGTWHLLWTWGWTRGADGKLRIGYSSSKDLIHWSPQKSIDVLADEARARNAWAPEAVWDARSREWILFWATTIPGRYPDSTGVAESGYNHRIYASRTKDWVRFTPAKVWLDPGFNSIDSTVVQDGRRWVMIFKDERLSPLGKRLRLAFADSPGGPWKDVTEAFSRDWVEGPSAVKVGQDWWIYFDHYRSPQHYGAIRTRDWTKFEDVTQQLSFPADHRHGTVVRIPEKTASELLTVRR